MRPIYAFAALLVSDRTTAVDWYSRVLGQAPYMLPNDGEAAWRLTETASLYVRVDPSRAGGGVVTLVVDRLEDALSELTERRIQVGEVTEVGASGRKAHLNDPDGNIMEIVEVASNS